jgi:hypothetical protein
MKERSSIFGMGKEEPAMIAIGWVATVYAEDKNVSLNVLIDGHFLYLGHEDEFGSC